MLSSYKIIVFMGCAMESSENLKSSSDEELFSALKNMRGKECTVIADIVRYLAEIDRRGVYRDFGYSSLFAFCTAGLKYSEGAAQRRIVAARCYKDNPEVYELLRGGSISLCSLSKVAKVIVPENKTEVLTLTQGLSKNEAERLAAQYAAPTKPKRETIKAKRVVVEVPKQESTSPVAVKPTTEERFSIHTEVDGECMELINTAKRYAGETKLGSLLKTVLREYVDRKRPKELKAGATMQEVSTGSRYIPKQVKDYVRLRDGERCTFIAKDGTRCSERIGLQFDHEIPFAIGGTSNAANLRLTCRAHNKLYAE